MGHTNHPQHSQHCALTIRSSGPLRRSAVTSSGTPQRPLNSSVRPHRSIFLYEPGRLCNSASPYAQSFACRSAGLRCRLLGGSQTKPAAARHSVVAPARRDRFSRAGRYHVALHRRPFLSPHFTVPSMLQRPNNSFKRTAATGCGTIVRRSAAAA